MAVVLRAYRDADLPLALALETDPAVMAHLGGPRSHADVERVHRRRLGDPLWLVIADDESDEPLGTIGAWQTEHDGATLWETGWTVLPHAQGRGVASAALALLLDRIGADPRIASLHAYPPETNAPSIRLCEKFGFVDHGVREYTFAGHVLRCHDYVRVSAGGSAGASRACPG